MIKNSSSIAMAALLLSGTITEEANATKVQQKAAHVDITNVQLENQQQSELQLEIDQELERKHRKSHKHNKANQDKVAQEKKAQEDYLMAQHRAVEKMRLQKRLQQIKQEEEVEAAAVIAAKKKKTPANPEKKPQNGQNKLAHKVCLSDDDPSCAASKVLDEDQNEVKVKKSSADQGEDQETLKELRKKFKKPSSEQKKPKNKKKNKKSAKKSKKADVDDDAESEEDSDSKEETESKSDDTETKAKTKATAENDSDDEEPVKEKSVVEKQQEDEIKKAAEHSKTSVDVIKAEMKIAELKKEAKENKDDLSKANEMVKKAKYEASTAITRKQKKETAEELDTALTLRNKQKRELEKTKSSIEEATQDKLQAEKEVPIVATTEDEINQEKKESYKEEAQADRQIESSKKEMKKAVSKVQQEIVESKYKEAKIKKKEALIKRERAYAKEQKSDETNEISDEMDASKLPVYEGKEEAAEKYYKAVTQNAVSDLERAIQTEKYMEERLENSNTTAQAITRKVDLQNAKLSKENAEKALVKAEQTQEEAIAKQKKKAIKQKILDDKIQEAADEEEEQVKSERRALKSHAKNAKHYKYKPKCEPEVVEAIKKGKAKADENTFKDVESDSAETKEVAESEPETDGEMKAQKMRNYFKKSNVYKNYKKEQQEEDLENQKIAATQQEISSVKLKMQQLMGKYQVLQNKVRQQNLMAKKFEDIEVQRLNNEQKEQAEEALESDKSEEQNQSEKDSVNQQAVKQSGTPHEIPIVAVTSSSPMTTFQNKQDKKDIPEIQTKSAQVTHEKITKGENMMTKASQKAKKESSIASQMLPKPQAANQANTAVKSQKPAIKVVPQAKASLAQTLSNSTNLVQQSTSQNNQKSPADSEPIKKNETKQTVIDIPSQKNITTAVKIEKTNEAPQAISTNKTAPIQQNKTTVKIENNITSASQAKNQSLAAPIASVKNQTIAVNQSKEAVHASAPANKQLIQLREYPQPDIRGPMPSNAHPDSTFSSHVHNDWTYLQTEKDKVTAPSFKEEYPTPEQRGPVPENAHPDVNFSSHLHDDWTHAQKTFVQTGSLDYPVVDQRQESLVQAYNGVEQDKRMFPEFEDEGDYVQLSSKEYPGQNVQQLAQGYEGMFSQDKRYFPFEEEGDYVQLRSAEYPHQNIQNLAQGYEGMFAEDKRYFPFEDEGDYVQLRNREYPNRNIQKLAQGYEGMFSEDKRYFPFEDEGDYVQLKSAEYPHQNIQNLAQGYEGMFSEDKRYFPEFEEEGDY